MERLRSREILIADGAIGSILLSRGLPKAQCPESYNISHTDVLTDIAKEYFEAGAEIIQTNTFGASPLKLKDYSLDEKTDSINRSAVQAVRNAVDDKAYISGSCGPSGKMLKPYGDIEPEEMYESFHMQITSLISAGVDIICIETMTDINEALFAIKAAKSISSTIPVMATMTFDPTPRGFFTIMGTDIPTAVKMLSDSGADVIGSNCGNGIENMIKIAADIKAETEIPVIIQSNAGLPELKDEKIIDSETPEFMAEKCKTLLSIGVNIIGGCCGTTPAHISAIAKVVAEFNNSRR